MLRYNLAVCRLERGQTRDAIDDLDAALAPPAYGPRRGILVNRGGNARRRLR